MTRKSKARNYHNPGQNNEQHATIAQYNRAIKLHPSDDKTYFQRGQAYGASGVYQQALLDYEQAFALDPAETMSLFQATLPLLDRALERDPSDAKAYFNRGFASIAFKDEQSALTDFERALELDPSLSAALKSYAHIRFENGDYDRAVQLSPSHPFVYLSRGCAYGKIKDYPRAIADFVGILFEKHIYFSFA